MRVWSCKVCRTTIIEYDRDVKLHCRCKMKLPGTWAKLFDTLEEEE